MISFLLQKMWKNKWMMLSLLIGNILLVGIVAGTPLYSEATMQRVLIKDMQQTQLDMNAHPTTSEFRYNLNGVSPERSEAIYYRVQNEIIPSIIKELDIPTINVVQSFQLSNITFSPVEPREITPRKREPMLVSFEGQEDHIQLLHGRLPSDTLVGGNIIECIASNAAMRQQDLLLDELMLVRNNQGYDDEETPRPVIYLRVVGIFEILEEEELYWPRNPNRMTNNLFISDKLLLNDFISETGTDYNIRSIWSIMLDYNNMWAGNVPDYQQTDERLKEEYNENNRVWSYSENFIRTLETYTVRANKLNLTLLVLQVPLYVLMAFYIFMVSRQILGLEQNDISVLKSRGAGRGQIFLVYLLQSLFVGILSILAGIPLGMLICRLLGASNGFLELMSRSSLTVRVSRNVLIFALVAILASILMMLSPVVRFSKVTIVDYKRNKFGRPKSPLWQRYFLDIICFGISIYALYNFTSQRELIAKAAMETENVDPILLLSSSLFIIGMGLVCLRLFPLLVRLVFTIGKRRMPPSPYVSLMKIIRSAGEEQFVMIFLVITLAVGIFSARAARTINRNVSDEIMHRAGTDLIIAESWGNNLPPETMMGAQLPLDFKLVWYEPDFERFTGIEEVDGIARVLEKRVTLRRSVSVVNNVQMMGIDTKDFGETMWYRDDLLPIHVNYFLNTLAMQGNGVLLSRNFRTDFGYSVGQTVRFKSDDDDNNVEAVICGFVDHWPGYEPIFVTSTAGGSRIQADAYLVVANLQYVQTVWGIQPYNIWFKSNTPTNSYMYDFVSDNNLKLIRFDDTKAAVVDSKSDPILQGTNGVLTVGFIVSLVVCFTGFLIYWILSIKSRVLQFGIFRAMGMSMRSILNILINEQIYTTLTSVAIGTIVGEVSSRLFIPLIQLSYNASEQIIPLLNYAETRDYVNLFTVIGIMIVICIIVLGVIISKLKIAQALKLGED